MSVKQDSLQEKIQTVIPLSPAQKWWRWTKQPILNVYIHGVLHFPVDGELFRATCSLLLQRHPLLRAVFPEREESESMLILEDPGALPILEEDMSGLPEEAFWDALNMRIARLHRQVDLTAWPLLQLGIFNRAEKTHIVIVVPTLIGDILMVKALSRELMVIYRALHLGQRPPAQSVMDDYGEYVRYVEGIPSETLQNYADKWQKELPKEPLLLPVDHRLGNNRLDSERMELVYWDLPSAVTGFSGEKEASVGIYAYVWLALVRVLREWTGRPDVTVCERSIGRNLQMKANLFKSVGFYAVDYPVCLRLERESPIKEQLGLISRTLEQGSMNGAVYNYLYSKNQQFPLPHELSPVRIDFVGRADTFNASGIEFLEGLARFGYRSGEPVMNYNFENVGNHYAESAGGADRLYQLDLSCVIVDGTLMIGVYYSCSLFKARNIRRFGDALADELTRIAEDAAKSGIRCIY
ncbi:condensation domain-containing protein [Paenibacillus macerans]|uniref:condensation domain-containing protein n=1 Tax=Paenibacillus macerans TaxID=44252 RepID=UPI00203FEB52|nr:condensation domain-containing protein [Paenibacillus macerans]MCM3701702.1 condensation domain-containing protein [Paenibacillus macerans]